MGPLVSGRLLKKKENCWVERTRAFDLSGHNVRPLRSRRDVFYLQPLQGNNKNIGSLKKNDNETFPERIVHRDRPSCGWEPCDSWPRVLDISADVSNITTSGAKSLLFKSPSFDFKLCVWFFMGYLQMIPSRCFFFFLVPCASFDTDATGGFFFCFIFCPLWNERERRKEYVCRAGVMFIYYNDSQLLSLLTFCLRRCGRLDVFLRL